MPIFKVEAPDGQLLKVDAPEGSSEEDIIAFAEQNYKPLKADTGISGARKAAYEDIAGNLALLKGKVGISTPEEATQEYERAKRRSEALFKPTEKGWTESPGLKFRELLGGSLPYAEIAGLAALAPLAPEVAAGRGLIAAGEAVAPSLLRRFAPNLAAGAATTPIYAGSALGRRMEETGEKLEDTSLGGALATGAGEAILDQIGFNMIPGVRRIFGAAGKEISDQAAKKIAEESFLATAKSYGGQALKSAGAEGTTEVAQAALERLYAGMSLTDEKAREEYFQNFLGGAVLGGTLSIPGHFFDRGATKAQQQGLNGLGPTPEAPETPPSPTTPPTAPPSELKALPAPQAEVPSQGREAVTNPMAWMAGPQAQQEFATNLPSEDAQLAKVAQEASTAYEQQKTPLGGVINPNTPIGRQLTSAQQEVEKLEQQNAPMFAPIEQKVEPTPEDQYHPELIQKINDVKQTLLPELKRFGLDTVGLRMVDSIENGTADGYYAKKLITVAMDTDDHLGTLRHESIHALKNLGAFNPNEWQVLTNKAKSEWIPQFIGPRAELYRQQYLKDNKGDLTGFDEYLQEEAIADAFKHFKNQLPAGMVGNIMYRLRQFFQSLGNAFRGHGFDTSDKIFRGIEETKYKPADLEADESLKHYEPLSYAGDLAFQGRRYALLQHASRTDFDTIEERRLNAFAFGYGAYASVTPDLHKKNISKKDVTETSMTYGRPYFDKVKGYIYLADFPLTKTNSIFTDRVLEEQPLMTQRFIDAGIVDPEMKGDLYRTTSEYGGRTIFAMRDVLEAMKKSYVEDMMNSGFPVTGLMNEKKPSSWMDFRDEFGIQKRLADELYSMGIEASVFSAGDDTHVVVHKPAAFNQALVGKYELLSNGDIKRVSGRDIGALGLLDKVKGLLARKNKQVKSIEPKDLPEGEEKVRYAKREINPEELDRHLYESATKAEYEKVKGGEDLRRFLDRISESFPDVTKEDLLGKYDAYIADQPRPVQELYKSIYKTAGKKFAKREQTAPEGIPQHIWDLHEKMQLADAEASGRATPVGVGGRGKSPAALKRNQVMAFRRLNKAVVDHVGEDESLNFMVKMNEESNRREEEGEKRRYSLVRPAVQGETEISTQNAQGVKAKYNPITEMLSIDEKAVMEAMKTNPDIRRRTIKAIKDYGFMPNGTPDSQVIPLFKKNIINNLLFLYNGVPKEIRERSKLWYDGANKIATQMGKDYGLTKEQVAGIFAAMSPQKDWFQNVSMGERAIDILSKRGDVAWDENMLMYAQSYINEATDRQDKEKRQIAFEKIKKVAEAGTPLKDMSEEDAAAFIRAYDEAYQSRDYRIVTPEGGFGGLVMNNPDKNGVVKPSTLMWSTYDPIKKSVSIFRDGSRENISDQLGFEHKIRSFYNNIAAPNSDISHVTIDTHAVAAGLFEALAGTDPEVLHNFGGTGKAKNLGVGGTYGVIADAYRDAANQVGLKAREMQSITWEAVRGLFNEDIKSTIKQPIRNEWAKYKEGKQTFDETRNKIIEIAGGVNDPQWVGTDQGEFIKDGASSYDKSFVPEGGVRLRQEKGVREKITVNLSNVTSSIPGLNEVYQRSLAGDKRAYTLLQRTAESHLNHLLSGTTAKTSVEPVMGVYGSEREPAINVSVSFPEEDRAQVMAPIARFATNFNQEQVHVRQKTAYPVGHDFGDGSYATPVYEIDTAKKLTNNDLADILEKTGIPALSVFDNKLITYWVDPNEDSESKFKEYFQQVKAVHKLVGRSGSNLKQGVERLYVYGSGYGATLGYESITGDVRTKEASDGTTTKLIAEYFKNEPIKPFKQKDLTQPEVKSQKKLAEVFEALPDNDLKRPMVRRAYTALAKELVQQFKILPIKVKVVTDVGMDGKSYEYFGKGVKDFKQALTRGMTEAQADEAIKYLQDNYGQPSPTWKTGLLSHITADNKDIYKNSQETVKDISGRNQLKVYKTSPQTFGTAKTSFKSHPLLKESGLKDIDGYPMLYNDLLRAVHDYYAHNLTEAQFGPKGEFAAAKNHLAVTKDPLAKWALIAETRLQNAWQNFRSGVENTAIKDRPFAEQKAALPPLQYTLTGDLSVDMPIYQFAKQLTPTERLGSLSPTSPLAKNQDKPFENPKYSLRGGMTDDRLNKVFSQFVYNDGRVKAGVSWVSPQDFLDAVNSREYQGYMLKQMEKYGPPNLEQSVPINLEISNDGEITGHEGRNRMLQLMKQGVDRVAVLVHRPSASNKSLPTRLAPQTNYGKDLKNDFGFRPLSIEPIPITYDNKELLKETFVDNADIRFSLRAPETPEFKRWFGSSKIVNADGTPKVMYHGTARDISEFRPKQANAIFVTSDPEFADEFAGMSENYIKKELLFTLPDDEQNTLIKAAIKRALKNGEITKVESERLNKASRYDLMQSAAVQDNVFSVMKDRMETGQNIMPVFVSSENPFDYANKRQVEAVVAELNKSFDSWGRKLGDKFEDSISRGNWEVIEKKFVQDAIKRLGHDGFYVLEGGRKNLGVHDPAQIKSATGNIGTYDIANPDIRYSLRNFLEPSKEKGVWYHGSSNDITEFKPKQANSIFLTQDPDFAGRYTQYSEDKNVSKLAEIIDKSSEKLPLITRLVDEAIADNRLGTNINSNGLIDTTREQHIETFMRRHLSSAAQSVGIGNQLTEELTKRLDVGKNIMPVYVRVTNPFDYENPKHINKVLKQASGELSKDSITWLKRGEWSTVESKPVQDAIKEIGFDGFYVREHGRKNLAVYSPNQIKSAIGNVGTFDVEKPDVRYSLNNKPPQTTTKLEAVQTAGQRLNSASDSVRDAMGADKNGFWQEMRVSWVDQGSALTKRLENLPIFDMKGQLRADLLNRARAQTINLVRNGLTGGIPVVGSDGSIIIKTDAVNNYAHSLELADRLNGNDFVRGAGMDGRSYVAEVARALRAEEINNEDKAFNQANPDEKPRVRNKLVSQAQIDWANKQLTNVPELEDIFRIWKNINTALVDLWEKTGLLDKKAADEFRAKKRYVSLAQSLEDMEDKMNSRLGYSSTGLKTVKKIQKLKGSEQSVNIWENLDKQFAMMTTAAYQNQVRKIAVNQLEGVGAARVTNSGDMNVNLRYKDPTDERAGKDGMVSVIVENPLDLMAFETFHYELNPIMKAMSGATNVLRAGALLNPMFWIRQLVRDPIHAALTNSPVVTPFHSAREFMRLMHEKSPEARLLSERGVIGPVGSTIDLQEFIEQAGKQYAPKGKVKGTLESMIHKMMEIHEASDAATRVAIFKKAKQDALAKGATEEQATNEAVFKARESINFSVRGNSQTLNSLRHMIPFLSAAISSLDTLYRAATGYGLPAEQKLEAQRLFKQRAAMMAIMSVAYAMMMQDDEEYQKLPDYIKDNNWLFHNPFGKGFVKIPVPYEVGFLTKTIPEGAIRYAYGTSTGKQVIESYLNGLGNSLPGDAVPLPQLVKPAIEVITNHSLFTGQTIESIGESHKPISERGKNASETAKELSKAGLSWIGLSPAKIDHLIQGYFAELGTFSTFVIDKAVYAGRGETPMDKDLAQQPFFKAFLTDPDKDKAIADFYELYKTANEVSAEFNEYKKTGQYEAAKSLMENEDKAKLINASKPLRRIADSMTKINTQIAQIKINQDIAPDERLQRVNALEKQLSIVARQYKKVTETLDIQE